jgi:hypothetical protein
MFNMSKKYSDFCLICGNLIDLKREDIYECIELGCAVPHCVKCKEKTHYNLDDNNNIKFDDKYISGY